jgi:hypothetical protein
VFDRVSRQATTIAIIAIFGLSAAAATTAGAGAPMVPSADTRALSPHAEPTGPPVARLAEPLPTPPATTERVSVGDNEVQGNAGSGGVTDLVDQSNGDQAISADGRWVAFVSAATNLIPGTDLAPGRLYLRDRQNGTTTAIPFFGRGGIWPPNVTAAEPSISADGSVVAFTAIAAGTTSGIAGPTGPTPYVLAWDRLTNTTTIVSMDAGGTAVPGFQPSVSGDGRYVAYTQWAPPPTPTPTVAPQSPVLTSLTITAPPRDPNDGRFYVFAPAAPCEPDRATFSVVASDPDGTVAAVTLFYQPTGLGEGSIPMSPAGGNTWTITLVAVNGWPSGPIAYSAQARDNQGNLSSRLFGSSVLYLGECIL